MGIVKAKCDGSDCGTVLETEEGDDFVSTDYGIYCMDCYGSMYEDLIPPEEEG